MFVFPEEVKYGVKCALCTKSHANSAYFDFVRVREGLVEGGISRSVVDLHLVLPEDDEKQQIEVRKTNPNTFKDLFLTVIKSWYV